jgi:hypothetical protein
MRSPLNPRRCSVLLAALLCSAALVASGQDSSGPASSSQSFSSQSLGDLARKTRQERSTSSRAPARRVTTEDLDGPDASGVWRMRLCTINPCYELSITLPQTPKWSRTEQEPRPALIPLAGHEDDPGRAIRVYAGESSDARYFLDSFKRTFLQAWFARPEYFGQSAQLLRDERVPLDFSTGIITHFTITTALLKYRGLSVVASSNQGNFGFACVYREEDSAVGNSICDAIVKSARYQELQSSFVRKVYPPVNYPQADPPEREEDDRP